MLEMRDKIDYEIDGLVYKVNSFALQKRLGEMSRAQGGLLLINYQA